MDKTDTELKLRDAGMQMRLALRHTGDEDVLRSCLNAFISHARSVTFVMQKESSSYPALIAWYEEHSEKLKQIPLLRFFNEKRIHSIHKGVVKPNKTTAPIRNLKIDGVLQPGTGEMTVWSFEGVKDYLPSDNGNVFRLCEQYFLILKWFVSEWLKKRDELEIHNHR